MKKIIFTLPEQEALGKNLALVSGCDLGKIELRSFPDGETYLRVLSDCSGCEAIILASLNHPNEKTVTLLLLASTLKDLGAKKVRLVAPYLPYLRQDKRFHPGESISAKSYAQIISRFFNDLATIDPHLHRLHDLSEVYTIPARTLHAAPLVWQWIKNNVENPLLIGPDEESRQWVEAAAISQNFPCLVLQKDRRGDRDVSITLPEVTQYINHTPVLVDDIISTAHTMIETVQALGMAGMNKTVCIGIHAIFAGNAYDDLLKAGVQTIITSNTIPHASNAIDVTSLVKDVL